MGKHVKANATTVARQLGYKKIMGKHVKANATTVARQLGYKKYMPDVFQRIKAAVTESEVTEILNECRHRWMEADYESL